MNQILANFSDAQVLSFVQGQAYRVNTEVIQQPYPNFAFNDLVFVDTTGPEWAPGVLTYTSDLSGLAKWQNSYAKDVPLADVSQDLSLRSFHLAAIGYQYNLEEVSTALNTIGGSLSSRRALAARMAYMRFMWNLTWFGDLTKGLSGLVNNPEVPTEVAAADGTGSVTWWVNDAGVGTKTSAQIQRDFNRGITGVSSATFGTIEADTVFLPEKAYNYIAGAVWSANTTETILSVLQRNNTYTAKTGRPLTIRSARELDTAATSSGSENTGRLVAYANNPTYVKLHLPMPHKFLPVWQDGPMNWQVPGIFRTGGVEMLAPATAYYLDGIVEDPAA